MPNYFVSIHGRGASYAFLVQNAETQDLANKCQPAVNSGFEVYIYELSASPLGQPPFTPTGALCLKRVYHLYDAHAEFEDEADSIISRLSAHSEAASAEYLKLMIDKLNTEFLSLKMIQRGEAVPSKGDVNVQTQNVVTQPAGEVHADDGKTEERTGAFGASPSTTDD